MLLVVCGGLAMVWNSVALLLTLLQCCGDDQLYLAVVCDLLLMQSKATMSLP